MEAEGNADEGIEAGGNADEGNEDKMYLFSDDESENIEAELDEDSVSTEEPLPNAISFPSNRKLKLLRLLLGGKPSLDLPSVVLHGKTTYREIKFNVISNHCQN